MFATFLFWDSYLCFLKWIARLRHTFLSPYKRRLCATSVSIAFSPCFLRVIAYSYKSPNPCLLHQFVILFGTSSRFWLHKISLRVRLLPHYSEALRRTCSPAPVSPSPFYHKVITHHVLHQRLQVLQRMATTRLLSNDDTERLTKYFYVL